MGFELTISDILISIIGDLRANQRSTGYKEVKLYLSKEKWLKEFCTVVLKLPRRSGITTAVNTVACSCFNPVIIPTRGTIYTMSPVGSVGKHYVSVDNLDYLQSSQPFDALIVDDASSKSSEYLDKIYKAAAEWAAASETFCLLLLG